MQLFSPGLLFSGDYIRYIFNFPVNVYSLYEADS